MSDIYMINDSGKVFRKGEEIGFIEDGDIKLKPDAQQYRASVTRWQNEQKDVEVSKPKAEIEAPKRKLTAQEQEELDNKGIAKEAQEDAKKSREAYRDDVAFAEKMKIETPPKKNPQFGDKTPAYVEWLKRYRPDKYTTLYGVKGKGKVPIIETNKETGIDEVTGYRETDMALRKTHMTEKVESAHGLGEDMSWDA